MSDGSGYWVDGVSVSNDGGASLPMGLWYPNEVMRCRVVDKNVDSGGGCSMGCVCPNGARTGHAGHVRLWWGHAQQVPEVGR